MFRSRSDNHSSDLLQLLKTLAPVWERENRLIELPDDRPTIFVGDIHGDRDAAEHVLSMFPPESGVLVFLGDILDRGPDSLGSLKVILRRKAEHPDSTHLLMGNHEAWAAVQFRPAGFWLELSPKEAHRIAEGLRPLPFAAWHPDGLLGVHGALPDLPALESIRDVDLGSDAWRAMTWGDWVDDDALKTFAGPRPAFGPSSFSKRANQLGVRLLIRSHQPASPLSMFADRCLTIFSTSAYGRGCRQVARWTPESTTSTVRDLELIEI